MKQGKKQFTVAKQKGTRFHLQTQVYLVIREVLYVSVL